MAKKKKKATKSKAKAITTRGKTKTKAKAKAKKVTKKATTKKTTTKKTVSKKATKATAKVQTTQPISKVAQKVKKARTKSDIFGILAETCGLSKKEIVQVFDNLNELINIDLGKKGPGVFNFPGLMKIVRVTKPATKARKGINPFTKEPMVFKAKPARNVVKVRALKSLKEMVQK
ncbi:MAG: HU family DNA-binding protein [Oligoflexales bacterium]|nr:HU family DNA-binding protein [Oligoflexales bacterium]